ncbi:putative prolyl 4-hydroxylase [Arachis hypogaea]|nr:putative prolyl 4-hydroxylase [Arachis hypogaea]
MAKGKYSRLQPRKSSSSTLMLSLLVAFTFVVLILLALGILSIPSPSRSRFPKPNDLTSIAHNTRDRSGGSEDDNGEQWVEVVSWSLELLFIIISWNIEKKIADFTFIPVEHGEGLQVLHYEVGQKYEPHYDYFQDEFNTKNGGQRIATVLMYLTDVEEGGETVFPAAKGNFSSLPWWNELSDCGKKGLSIKPKRGDALLFWSMRPDATLDPSSLHGGCPVIKGNKWSSTKWMRVSEYKA